MLGITSHAIKKDVAHALARMHASNRTELAASSRVACRIPRDIRVRAAIAPDAVVALRDFCAFNLDRRAETAFDGEVMGGRAMGWPLRALWRAVTIFWQRCSHTFVLRAA